MAVVGSIVTKEMEPAARKFVQQASVDQLQQIAAATTLARHPLVSNPQGTPEQKTESLRKLVAQKMRRHADLRGMVIRLLAQKNLVSPPVKEAKAEAPAAAKKEGGDKEKKPKKEKEKGGEKAKDKEKDK